MSGGYEYEVVGEAIQDLFCPICLNLMKNAMELECGHAMCQTCLQNLEASSKERGFGFVCPSCQQEIDIERVNPAKTINRIVLGVKVKCENFIKGCPWIGELSNMLYHLQKECNFQLVNCAFEHCKEAIERHMICNHREECLYQPVTCEYCSVTCLKLEMQDHYNTCEKYPVLCPNKCSLEKMERNMVGDHRKSCSNEVISCEFSPFGCQFEINQEKLFNEVVRKLFEEGQERQIESIVKSDKRFSFLLNTMKVNTKYSCDKGHFYKINLDLFNFREVLLDNEDESVICNSSELYFEKKNPAVKSFIVYNSEMGQKKFNIDGKHKIINVKDLMNKKFVLNPSLLVSYYH